MNEENAPILLMTSAIDHRGCVASLFDPKTRERQYKHALRCVCRTLRKGPIQQVVYCDNSGRSLDSFRALVPTDLVGQIEFVSLSPELFDPSKGKSWNEMLAIDLVMDESAFLRTGDPLVIKQTGRYPILNLSRIAFDIASRPDSVQLSFFPMIPVRGVSSVNHPPLADTRCIAFRKSLWNNDFRGTYSTTKPNIRHIEHIAFEVWKKHRDEPGFAFFRYAPLILGKQGSVLRVHGFRIPKLLEPAFLVARRIHHILAFRHWERRGCPDLQA